jgi:hypothetical protein
LTMRERIRRTHLRICLVIGHYLPVGVAASKLRRPKSMSNPWQHKRKKP